MPIPSQEQQLEIARRVHETFDRPARWLQSEWGLDDDGLAIEFAGGLHVVDDEGFTRHPAYSRDTPQTRRRFCLGAAVRIHTGTVLRFDPSHTGKATEAVAAHYARLAGIDTDYRERNPRDSEPHLNALIEWNDSGERSFEDVRALTAAALRHLDARRR